MSILVTGGAGYIGSHTAVELLNLGYDVVIADNLCNSNQVSIDRIRQITGKAPVFIKADLRKYSQVKKIFVQNKIDIVIHFAGLKAVGESVAMPVKYYENNLYSTINILKAMQEFSCHKFIFSSSATVYGDPEKLPLTEECRLSATNPYGATKLMIERILKDACVANPKLSVVSLRYFNPVGAHKTALIGEDPGGIPNNLMPYLAQVAAGKLKELPVYGNDYPTPDGTGRRDYIHITDLALGHIAALTALTTPGFKAYNLGTGRSFSVLEMIAAFERAAGRKLPYRIDKRRAGDIAECYANCDKARRELGWSAKLGLDDMCRDLWRWQAAGGFKGK